MKTWDDLGSSHGTIFQALRAKKRHHLTHKASIRTQLNCIIEKRSFIVTIIYKHATKSTNNLGNREALWEGIIPADRCLKW